MSRPDNQPRLGKAIEDLINRAKADEAFREHLLLERSGAAAAIGIDLHPTEKRLLDSYPTDHLAAMTKPTTSSIGDRRQFLKAAAVVAAASGLIGSITAGETDKKKDSAKGCKAEVDSMLEQLNKLKAELKTIRKQLQKETTETKAKVAKRKTETVEVERKFVVVAGIPPAPERKPRGKTVAEKKRDEAELKRVDALSKALEEIAAELESAQLELQLKKKALEKK